MVESQVVFKIFYKIVFLYQVKYLILLWEMCGYYYFPSEYFKKLSAHDLILFIGTAILLHLPFKHRYVLKTV